MMTTSTSIKDQFYKLFPLVKEDKLCKDNFDECVELDRNIRAASIFSSNEDYSDINPVYIKYLISDFMLAVVLECFQEERERLDHLKLAYNHYMKFLTNCLRYGLIPKDTLEHGELSRYFLEDKDSDEIKEERFEKWLKNVPRDLKIDRMKRIILLRSKTITVDQFKSDPTDEEGGEEESDLENIMWTDWIVCCVLMTLDKVGLLLREVELIEAGQNPEKKFESSIPAAVNIDIDDKLTKVERPFKLVKDRKQIASDAFKYGHSLPTMTIDEYLSLERKRGNIIEGGGAGSAIKREIDEDNEGEMEIELLKARAFDEIKDMYARGSGNTYNRS